MDADIRIPLTNDALQPGWGPWEMPAGWTLEPNAGPQGGPALKLTRTDPAEYTLARLPFSLPAEARCRMEASIKVEGVTSGTLWSLGGVEFFDDQNRYLGGGNLGGTCEPGKWVRGVTEFTVPRFTAVCKLQFYARPGATGTVLFADPVIGPAPFRWTVYPLTPVRDELPAGNGPIPFAFFSQGKKEGVEESGWRCRAELAVAGAAPVSREAAIGDEGRFTLDFGKLPPGKASLWYELKAADGSILGTKETPVAVVTEAEVRERVRRGCVVDAKGRLTVKGGKYFPLGLYMGYVQLDELEDIRESAFNCLIPYGSCSMTLTGSTKKDVEGAREVMDACEAHGIKVIFSLAGAYDEPGAPAVEGLGVKTAAAVTNTAVTAFRNHPALLGWYLNDEQPIECLPRILKRRRQVRELDPNHPIYAVMCQIPEFPLYAEITDVYGIDPYPIVDPAMNHIKLSQYAHTMAERAVKSPEGVPLWTVVQAHNIGAYDQKAKVDPKFYKENYRDPSFEEILALSLLAVMHGAKGLIYYSYPDLGHPTFDAATRPRRWANTKRAAQAVKDVEAFLLSDAEAPALDVRVTEGNIEAKAFRDEAGRLCVLLVGVGPGPCRAVFRAPAGMKSMICHTRLLNTGEYEFTGTDVSADVLMPG